MLRTGANAVAAPGTDSRHVLSSDRQATGVLGYHPDLVQDVVRFQREAYPTRRPDWIEPRWLWMFVESAKRLGVEPLVWVYRRPSGIVAHQGLIPVRLKVGQRELTTGWFVETMALESVRGKAIGPMIVARALQDAPMNLSLGQTEQMRQLQYKLGWHLVGVMDSWLLVISPRRAFAGRVRNAAARSALATAAWSWQWALRTRLRRQVDRRRFESRPVERFGSEHDDLWTEVCDQYDCAVVRDASYLNWKYVSQPGQQFRRIELRQRDKVCGICVMTIHEPDDLHAYRRGWIIDLVARHADSVCLHALLGAAATEAAASEVDVLEFDLLGAQLASPLRKFGFIRGGKTRQLLVADGRCDPETGMMLRSASSWYATRGDSDGDHPWWTAIGRVEPGALSATAAPTAASSLVQARKWD